VPIGSGAGEPIKGADGRSTENLEVTVSRIRVLVSFDLDHDNDLKTRLVDESAAPDSLFTVCDFSIREVAVDWKDKARKRIANVDLLLAICGDHTETAANVNFEIALAREAQKPYFLLDGRPGRSQKPVAASADDRVLHWNSGPSRAPISS